jgi:hypothetical protein
MSLLRAKVLRYLAEPNKDTLLSLLFSLEVDIVDRTERSFLHETEEQLISPVRSTNRNTIDGLLHAILGRIVLLERVEKSLVSMDMLADVVKVQYNMMSAIANNSEAISGIHQSSGNAAAGNGRTLKMVKSTPVSPVRMLMHHQLQRNTRKSTAFSHGVPTGWVDIPTTSENQNTYSLDYYYVLWAENHTFGWHNSSEVLTRGVRLSTYTRDHDMPADDTAEITINPEGLGALYRKYLSTILKGLVVLGGRVGVISFEANDLTGLFDLLEESTASSFTIPNRVSNYVDGKFGMVEGSIELRSPAGLTQLREDFLGETAFLRSGSGSLAHDEEAFRWKRTIFVGNASLPNGLVANATRVFELDLGTDLTETHVVLDSGEFPSFALGGDGFDSTYVPENDVVATRIASLWTAVSPVEGFTVTIS